MSRLYIALATLAALVLIGAVAYSYGARSAEQDAAELRLEIERIAGERSESERQVAERTRQLEQVQARLAAAESQASLALETHAQTAARIDARLRAMGQKLEERETASQALNLGLKPPPSLSLDDCWEAWGSCEDALGGALVVQEQCQHVIARQALVLEAAGAVELSLREEISARTELERDLRRSLRRTKRAGHLKIAGAAALGYVIAEAF